MKKRDEFKALRRKLVLLYMLTAGGVLTAVLAAFLANSESQRILQRRASFQELFSNASDLVRSSVAVSHTQLSDMERKNRIVIQIEDGGIPFLYPGAWTPPTGREILVQRLRELTEADGIATNRRPASVKEEKSGLYTIKGEAGDRYLGMAYITAHETGYRTLFFLQSVSERPEVKRRQGLQYLAIWLFGLAALYLISRIFVGRAVKPVEEGQRRQKEFIAAASHELRSPLAVIRSNGAALLASLQSRMDREETHFLSGIDRECVRMSRLIDDMLLLSSVGSKTWKINREPVDMDGLLIEVFDRYSTYCRERGITLKLELKETLLPQIAADKERVIQILFILIQNAVSYTCPGDTVILRGDTKKMKFANVLVLDVEDHGPGIPDEKKKEVFERFYRADSSRKDKTHFGLGLSVAKELTELQGGRIAIADTPGGGADFRIYFPF